MSTLPSKKQRQFLKTTGRVVSDCAKASHVVNLKGEVGQVCPDRGIIDFNGWQVKGQIALTDELCILAGLLPVAQPESRDSLKCEWEATVGMDGRLSGFPQHMVGQPLVIKRKKGSK